MTSVGITCRWPPVYNFEDLGATIKEALENQEIFTYFYSRPGSREPDFCQGDIINLETAFPFIEGNGNVVVTEDEFVYWLIAGNSCDISRDIGEVSYTSLVPLISVPDSCGGSLISDLKHYKAYRKFYIPDWNNPCERGYLADFTRMCSVHKDIFSGTATLAARMDYRSWVLLHACLVRYLARDDGRHD